MPKFKKPSNTSCILVIVLLVFVILSCGFIYREVINLVAPLSVDEMYNVVNSDYANMEIIDSGTTYNIYRDIDTDVLYIEIMRNGYSSAFSVLLNEDGSPKKYAQFNNG